ncbi:hypothetical protein J4526_06530 [Desulfurococcaceae archaeon MEX13E-LK6-19]|nr:hypothetical protein J4526_06530 [Desulfurococcaceae archaeon MEX13E-LK6-19]
MVHLERTGFGFIVIDGKKYDEDIVICMNNVELRPKELSRKYRGLFGHTPLSREEIEYLVDSCGKPEAIIIGTGQYGDLPIMNDAMEYISNLGVELYVDRTPKILDIVNEMLDENKKIIAIIHLTC